MCIMSLLFLVVMFALTAMKMHHKIMKLSQAPVLLAMVVSAILSIVIVMVFFGQVDDVSCPLQVSSGRPE